MMPVGGYFKVGTDPCEDEVHFHKQVVQMYKIPSYMLEVIVPNDTDEPPSDPDAPEEIFFFDVPNAHDGLCDCSN